MYNSIRTKHAKPMKPALRLFVYLLPLALLTACATIFNTSKQKITFSSNPIGAEVYINGKSTGKTTPCAVWVKRKVQPGPINIRNQYVFELKKEGYVPYAFTDNANVSGKIWLNLLWGVGALPAFGIDIISGSAFYYNDEIVAPLQKEKIVIRDTIVRQEIVYVPSRIKAEYQFERKSDVDIDIPDIGKQYPYRFALIIGNEDYSSKQTDLSEEVNVAYARNDASAFRDYAVTLLGIPPQNIVFLLDATSGQMRQALAKMNLIIKHTKGKAEVFVYYAGHGLPDEVSREPYLIPVDISGTRAIDGIKLSDLYNRLTEYPSKRIVVFMDACFSGGGRNKGLIAARGVKVRPKEGIIKGNLVALSATSGDQSALPYSQKYHGFFTYYLLKKLKESAGALTLKELTNYLCDVVPLQSVVLNNKEQTPTLKLSSNATEELLNWKFTDK